MAVDLHGCVIGVFVSQGVDERHLHALAARSKRSGAKVHFLGLETVAVRTLTGEMWQTDVRAEDVSPGYYDAFVIPAGDTNWSSRAIALLQAFALSRRPIGALGNGVRVLAEAGLISGLRIAAQPSFREMLLSEGAIPVPDTVVADRILVTSAEADAIEPFCERFLEDVEAYRKREYLDEASMESFPGSDSTSAAGI